MTNSHQIQFLHQCFVLSLPHITSHVNDSNWFCTGSYTKIVNLEKREHCYCINKYPESITPYSSSSTTVLTVVQCGNSQIISGLHNLFSWLKPLSAHLITHRDDVPRCHQILWKRWTNLHKCEPICKKKKRKKNNPSIFFLHQWIVLCAPFFLTTICVFWP